MDKSANSYATNQGVNKNGDDAVERESCEIICCIFETSTKVAIVHTLLTTTGTNQLV